MSEQCPRDGTHRLVDLPTLNRCTTSYREHLKTYARFLNLISSYRINESIQAETDEIAAAISTKNGCPIDDDDFLNITEFLTAVRIGFGMGKVRLDNYTCKNAYEMITIVTYDAAIEWRELRTVSPQAFELASDVFGKEIRPWLPTPNELYALMMVDYSLARKLLLIKRRARRRGKNLTGDE